MTREQATNEITEAARKVVQRGARFTTFTAARRYFRQRELRYGYWGDIVATIGLRDTINIYADAAVEETFRHADT